MSERSPRAPVLFVAARHLIQHPDDVPSRLADHCHIQRASASRALKRLTEETDLLPGLLLEAMLRAQEKPRWITFHFRAPNPDQWEQAADIPYWLSGEHAAEVVDDLDVASERRTVYVRPEDAETATRIAHDVYAKRCAPHDANLRIRVADPWMDMTGRHAEKGQRWYDYKNSSNLQLLRWHP